MYGSTSVYIIIDDYILYNLYVFVKCVDFSLGVFLSSIQLESEVNVDVLRDLMPNVATAKMCLDRVFRSTTSVSEVGNKTSIYNYIL